MQNENFILRSVSLVGWLFSVCKNFWTENILIFFLNSVNERMLNLYSERFSTAFTAGS